MERYLDIARVEPSTRQGYEGLVRNQSSRCSAIDRSAVSAVRLSTRSTPSSGGVVSICRRGQAMVDHRTVVEHECDERCRPHRCRPLGEGTIRHAHNLLNGAFALAVADKASEQNQLDQQF